MTWYNPLSWLKETNNSQISELYCDNSQCGKPLKSEFVAYSIRDEEVYHVGECEIFAIAHKTMDIQRAIVGGTERIKLKKALRLLDSGKLTQSPTLEDKVD